MGEGREVIKREGREGDTTREGRGNYGDEDGT